ncbi:hypothetical protein GXP70_12360 [Paenibacillus lycopersici]|uniref:Uncharacterized protein n=1 Tax=Paenibacillus lycopersici TaxID=2704462 RepID=A0A6C0FYT2_9BACL|nr:hypothetical protein [Paenibacillus lycopersici]QHT60653.1 hypothetical protein GXP70_12360 [Paenibacillus lycopersici]
MVKVKDLIAELSKFDADKDIHVMMPDSFEVVTGVNYITRLDDEKVIYIKAQVSE